MEYENQDAYYDAEEEMARVEELRMKNQGFTFKKSTEALVILCEKFAEDNNYKS